MNLRAEPQTVLNDHNRDLEYILVWLQIYIRSPKEKPDNLSGFHVRALLRLQRVLVGFVCL